MALDEADGSHDTVIVTRVVINLAEWEHQQTALRECARVTAHGASAGEQQRERDAHREQCAPAQRPLKEPLARQRSDFYAGWQATSPW